MDIEYRRDMNHNYMIVKGAGPDVPDDYETRVISANRIPGLLNCSMQYIDAEIWYSYDVTSLQKLTVFCESRKIGKSEIMKILSEILRILEGLEDYLLDFQHLILTPSCVCMDFDTMEIRLMYVPFYSRDIRKSLRELAEYLLGCTDHSDQCAIVLGYRFCHEVQEDNTQLGDLMGVLYGKDMPGVEAQAEGIARAESGINIQQFAAEQTEGNPDAGRMAIHAESLAVPAERGPGGEPGAYLQRSEKEKRRKAMWIPGRPALAAVFTGILILAAVYVFLHTNLLRHISIYTICGMGAGICAVILFVYLVRERSGTEKDVQGVCREKMPKGRQEKMQKGQQEKIPKELQEIPSAGETSGDIQILPDAADMSPGILEQRSVLADDIRDDLPVTTLLSSYRPVRGPEDRWLLPKSEGMSEIHLTGNDMLIGKNQQYAEMIIDSPAVSRIHARLRFRAGRYFIEDLSSRNGTTVNGEPLCGEEERVLAEGDVITFADVSYIFSRAEKGADCESHGGGV